MDKFRITTQAKTCKSRRPSKTDKKRPRYVMLPNFCDKDSSALEDAGKDVLRGAGGTPAGSTVFSTPQKPPAGRQRH